MKPFLILAMTLLTTATTVEAQTAYAPKTAEDVAADKITAAENQKYVELSRAVDARNAAKKAAYEASLADHAAAVAKIKADDEAAQAAYATAVVVWKQQVAACAARDLKNCPTARPAR
jgi:hypothetical protein